MSLSLWLATMWRESRGARSRLIFFTACVAVGVCAVVGVASLIDAIESGIRLRSRELLGGDLAIDSRRPLPNLDPLWPRELSAPPLRRVDMAVLSTMVRTDSGQSRLAELKAVDRTHGDYPLAGTLTLEPAQPLAQLLDDHSVLIARPIAHEQHLAVGDGLFVGTERFRIAGIIDREPDAMTFTFTFGPRVLMTKAGLDRTGLLGTGNRVRYRALMSLPPTAALPQLKQVLEKRIPGGGSYVRVETHEDAQPQLRTTLDRVQRYLGLVALLSLLIASVGVAQIVTTWLAQAAPQTAILRCLGLRPREVLWLYLGHVLLLAWLGSIIGSALGALLPTLVARVYPDLTSADAITQIPWRPMLRGQLLGVGVALVFSLPPLTAVWQVSPARVLRAEAAPLPVPLAVRVVSLGLLFAGIVAAAFAQAHEPKLALGFAGGVTLLAAALWLCARGLLWGVSRLPRARLPVLFWQGAAALARPGAGAIGSIVALGMGSLVVLAITLIQGILTREIVTALPPDAPSVFLLDVQSDQWPSVEQLATAAHATNLQRVPVVMARLLAIDGTSVDELVKQRAAGANDEDRVRWVLTREQRITSSRTLPASNRLIAGSLWQKPNTNEVSIEADFARDLRVGIGNKLRFDVQGVPIDFEVTSLRNVEWRSFSVNFFLVAEPGVLDEAPQSLLVAMRVPLAAEQALQDRLAASVPNVTVVRVREVIERASQWLDQAAIAVRLLGGFAALTGLVILAGAVAVAQLRRAREAALLKALGLTRARVAALFAVEYALAGAVAGLIAATGAYALATVFTRFVLELATLPSLLVCFVGWAATVALSVGAGLLASARALTVAPLQVFREQA